MSSRKGGARYRQFTVDEAEKALRHVSDASIASFITDIEIAEKESKTKREFVERVLAALSMVGPVRMKVV